MDRSILEADPHAVLEGMVIAAKAIGAHSGYIYCRAEYPLAIQNLHTALEQARQCGLLGENILGSGLSFDVHIVRGAGAFVFRLEGDHDNVVGLPVGLTLEALAVRGIHPTGPATSGG